MSEDNKTESKETMTHIAPRYSQREGASSDPVHNQRAALTVNTSTPTARQSIGRCRVGKR